jgi:hypothetical protein
MKASGERMGRPIKPALPRSNQDPEDNEDPIVDSVRRQPSGGTL